MREWSRCCELLGLGDPLGYGDAEPESLDPLAQPLYLSFWIVMSLEVVSPQILVEFAIGEEMPDDVEHGVGEPNGCFVWTSPFGDSRVLS
ncbi:hypothetical protein [Ferrimicrobium sp.]|uniref:hypothetical protein n=1 Tax=Ferrimicrobium sp. TaxID=2926050 RepID=UPI00263A317D|nr:hypothetical protein [Ferrimicrobium sp.]